MARGDFAINSIIGPGTTIRGDISAAGFTSVDGSIAGDVTAEGRVVIGVNARMKSNVTGTFVTIGGVVFGDVLASEKIDILSTGLVYGDIITRRIKADDGCLIHGKVTVCTSDEKWRDAVSEYRDIAGIRSRLESEQ